MTPRNPTTPRKKLIEVSIPLDAINEAAAREKSIRHGHPSTLHLWWARRPLAACRAVLFAQLVDDPSAWPELFPTAEAQERERKRLHDLIRRLVPWEASNDERVLAEARFEIARSIARGRGEDPPPREDAKAVLAYLQEKAPPVFDPFCGGGSIPLEAQRLGLRAVASDLNPVAVLITKALVEIPPAFAGLPPVNPKARAGLARGAWQGKGAEGLAEDVRFYGRWMREEAERRIGHLYPKVEITAEMAERRPDLRPYLGQELTVIAWLWARTVRSPDPSAKGAMVPLVSSFMLSTKEGKKAWVEVVRDAAAPDGWRFEVRTGALSKAEEERLKNGTKAGKGQAFVCTRSGTPISRSYIQAEGKAGRLSERLMAIVAEGSRGRLYIDPKDAHEKSASTIRNNPSVTEARTTFLSGSTPTRAMITGGVCSAYGLRTWGDLFTPRQLVALTTFSDLVGEARAKVLEDARRLGLPDDPTPLHAGGRGATAYADAVATYLGLTVGRSVDASSTLTSWASTGEFVRNTFARQALPMVWDYAECNPLSNATGSFNNNHKWCCTVLCHLSATSLCEINQLRAQDARLQSSFLVSTDPPYYDNVGYADLSDFFYVWLRRSLKDLWPELFRRLTTPKDEELVATPYRHGSKEKAEAFFMEGMKKALANLRAVAAEDAPLTIYYSYRQSETNGEGLLSAGWAAFLQAVVDAGLVVDGTWPLRTEREARTVGLGANVLASSIVLVCRKRPERAPVITRDELLRALRRELPAAVAAIRKAGVGPVDMQQAVIGPGMAVFSRNARVLEDDDSPMTVKTALALVNRVWDELESELDATLDPETQVALSWYADYGFDARASGELITLANAKNTAIDALFEAGIFRNLKGRAALLARKELPADWRPSADRRLTVWECAQHTARVLRAEDGGLDAAARLVAEMDAATRDATRALAYRLYEIAARKRWTQEALVWNELAETWPTLVDRAEEAARGGRSAPEQAALNV